MWGRPANSESGAVVAVMSDQPAPPVVSLEHWHSPIWGDRWTLVHERRAVITRSTECEVRAEAVRSGWTVVGEG